MGKFLMLNERLHRYSPNINVCFRINVEGHFGKKQIGEAIITVCKKHPLTNCSMEIDNDNNAWLVQSKKSFEIEYYKPNEMEWKTWYKKTDSLPFDFVQGPLIKFCVISDGNNIEIIILGHHVIGDGIGYLNFAKDLLLALDNNIDTNPQIPPTDPVDRYFKETILLDNMTKSYANGLNEEWRKNRVRLTEKDYLSFFEKYRKKFVPNLYMASLEEDGLRQLLQKCKSNNLTVNEVIASAFSAALIEIAGFPDKEIRLGVAANIRNELVKEPNSCMGNYVTGISAKIHYNPQETFISNARDIAATLKAELKNPQKRHLVIHFLNEFDKDLIESIMPAVYGNYDLPLSKQLGALIGEQAENKGIGISNLGRYELNGYNNFKIVDIQFIGPVFPANLLTVGIITVNNKLNICLRYNETEINTEIIKTIYGKAINLING